MRTKRGAAKLVVEPYETKPLLYRVKTKDGYVSFGSMKSVKKFIRKMKNSEARKAAKQS